jgi:hypothetical protein
MINKTSNEYAEMIASDFYEKCPKAVFAAMAVAYPFNSGTESNKITAALHQEWENLYNSGIVSQKPPKSKH